MKRQIFLRVTVGLMLVLFTANSACRRNKGGGAQGGGEEGGGQGGGAGGGAGGHEGPAKSSMPSGAKTQPEEGGLEKAAIELLEQIKKEVNIPEVDWTPDEYQKLKQMVAQMLSARENEASIREKVTGLVRRLFCARLQKGADDKPNAEFFGKSCKEMIDTAWKAAGKPETGPSDSARAKQNQYIFDEVCAGTAREDINKRLAAYFGASDGSGVPARTQPAAAPGSATAPVSTAPDVGPADTKDEHAGKPR